MPDTTLPLLAVEVTAGHPPTTVLRYVCRLCEQNRKIKPMTAEVAVAHLALKHSWAAARYAVERAESEYGARVAEVSDD